LSYFADVMLTYERYQALCAINIRVPGEPGNEARNLVRWDAPWRTPRRPYCIIYALSKKAHTHNNILRENFRLKRTVVQTDLSSGGSCGRRRASVAHWRAALRLSRSLCLLRALASSFWRSLYLWVLTLPCNLRRLLHWIRWGRHL